jgi:hypothetical protein
VRACLVRINSALGHLQNGGDTVPLAPFDFAFFLLSINFSVSLFYRPRLSGYWSL